LKKFDDSSKKDWSSFAQSVVKKESTSRSKPRPGTYENFWEAPSRVWRPRVRQISEEEMDAVIVSEIHAFGVSRRC
jgi:small subunit ribosomal protein YMR-31